MSLNPTTTSPGHTARLVAATGVPLNKRVLAYHEAPPAASDTTLTKQREIARPLYSRPGALASSSGAVTNRSRKIATQPERVLDAPGMVDDFYLNLLSWSVQNVVAVALAENTYIWRADSGDVVQVGEAPEGTYVSSVDFSNDGSFLGVGVGSGDVELWDVESGQKLRSMGGHQAQIAALSWHGHILSSACGDGSIWHHDVRVARHKVMELLGHSGEVCGLKWRADGELLASGGNDNVVNIWDGRVGDVTEGSRGVARWTKRNHSAAVKVLYHVFIFFQFLLFRTVSFPSGAAFSCSRFFCPFHRLWHGAHGSRPFWQAAAVRTMLRSTFGIARREEDCIL
jgi:cell division cycle 20, cofactor of APC complex